MFISVLVVSVLNVYICTSCECVANYNFCICSCCECVECLYLYLL